MKIISNSLIEQYCERMGIIAPASFEIQDDLYDKQRGHIERQFPGRNDDIQNAHAIARCLSLGVKKDIPPEMKKENHSIAASQIVIAPVVHWLKIIAGLLFLLLVLSVVKVMAQDVLLFTDSDNNPVGTCFVCSIQEGDKIEITKSGSTYTFTVETSSLPAANAIPKAAATGLLDPGWLPTPAAAARGTIYSETCAGTDKVSGVGTDGHVNCTADAGGSASPGGVSGDLQANDGASGFSAANLNQSASTGAISASKSLATKAVAVAYAAGITIDLSLANRFEVTLTGNVTSVTFTNKVAGAKFSIAWIQDGTGSRTVDYAGGASSTCGIEGAALSSTTQKFEISTTSAVEGSGCYPNAGPSIGGTEQGTPSPIPPAGRWGCYGDSTTHHLICNSNNSSSKHTTVFGSAADPADGNAVLWIGTDGTVNRGNVDVDETMFTFTDITTANASASGHGLLPKLSGSASDCFLGNGTYGACPSSSTTLATSGAGWASLFGDCGYCNGTPAVGTTNYAQYYQFVCCANAGGASITVATFGFYISTAGTNGIIKIYSDSSGTCGSIVGGTNYFSTGSTGYTYIASSAAFTLTNGTVYWVGISGDANWALRGSDISVTGNFSFLLSNAANARNGSGNASTGSGATLAMPATCGTISAGNNQGVPMVMLFP